MPGLSQVRVLLKDFIMRGRWGGCGRGSGGRKTGTTVLEQQLKKEKI